MDNLEDISFRLCRTVKIVFNSEYDYGVEVPGNYPIPLQDCQYIWEEVQYADKIQKLSQHFEESSQLLLSQLQNDQVSEHGKSTILNFLCQIGAISVNMVPYMNRKSGERKVDNLNLQRNSSKKRKGTACNSSSQNCIYRSDGETIIDEDMLVAKATTILAVEQTDINDDNIPESRTETLEIKAENDSDSENVFNVWNEDSAGIRVQQDKQCTERDEVVVNTIQQKIFSLSEPMRKNARLSQSRRKHESENSRTSQAEPFPNPLSSCGKETANFDALSSHAQDSSGRFQAEYSEEVMAQAPVYSDMDCDTSSGYIVAPHPVSLNESTTVVQQHSSPEDPATFINNTAIAGRQNCAEVTPYIDSSPPGVNATRFTHGTDIGIGLMTAMTSKLHPPSATMTLYDDITYMNNKTPLHSNTIAASSSNADRSSDPGANAKGNSSSRRHKITSQQNRSRDTSNHIRLDRDTTVVLPTTDENDLISEQNQTPFDSGNIHAPALNNLDSAVHFGKYPVRQWSRQAFRDDGLARQFVCGECGKRFVHKRSLTFHMKIHQDKKLYVCNICGARSKYKSNLARHLAKHIGESFQCKTCGKSFQNKAVLIAHRKAHIREKNYKCEICSKMFSREKLLGIHMSKHVVGSVS
ncbi:uncharacterized protein [Ptychodera flava]|uniref:uncharacterized protein n=1 Tax=Ptychodera flava TaxID=63121 RepID=UPI00396A54CF